MCSRQHHYIITQGADKLFFYDTLAEYEYELMNGQMTYQKVGTRREKIAKFSL